jgi:hypothetical protein
VSSRRAPWSILVGTTGDWSLRTPVQDQRPMVTLDKSKPLLGNESAQHLDISVWYAEFPKSHDVVATFLSLTMLLRRRGGPVREVDWLRAFVQASSATLKFALAPSRSLP